MSSITDALALPFMGIPSQDLLDLLPAGVLVLESSGRLRRANPAAARLLAYEPARLMRQHGNDLTRGMTDEVGRLFDAATCPVRRLLRGEAAATDQVVGVIDGRNERRWMKLTLRPLMVEPGVPGMICSFVDITETCRLEQHLARLAHTDSLTGLANAAALESALAARFAPEAGARPLALLVMDLDGFRHVNDTLGHAAGDRLLVAVAARLTEEIQDNQVLARRGGDEFVLLVPGGAGLASDLAARLLARLAEPFELDGQEIFVAASIGAALRPDHADDPDRLFRLAEAGMYEAKRRQCGFRLHSDQLVRSPVNRVALDAQLHRAVEQKQFVLHYQPRFHTDTGRLCAVEALARWQHPERGLVLPGEFIELAEDTGLITEIGRWVLHESCRQAMAWQHDDLVPLRVSVNVSARQFHEEFFARTVPEALAATGLPADRLELEITETAMMDERSEAALPALNALRAQGLRVLLDDFGTGYSSLSYLHRFPLDGVKIDRSFVQRLPQAPEARAIVCAILGIADALGLETIAEGVETPAQRDFLVDLGCPQLQGWLLSKPVTAAVMGVLMTIGRC